MYMETVTNSDSDVLIDFYAPWCSICVQNKPIYREIAKRFIEVRTKILIVTFEIHSYHYSLFVYIITISTDTVSFTSRISFSKSVNIKNISLFHHLK